MHTFDKLDDLNETPETSKKPGKKTPKVEQARNLAAEISPPGTNAVSQIIELAKIRPSPTNPRKNFTDIAELAHSLRTVGVLEPLLVREVKTDLFEGYELICGERRYRAAKLTGLLIVPCRVLEVTDAQALETQARENLDRSDLDPIERALTYQQLLDTGDYTQETLAKQFKVSQESISNSVRMLKLPALVQTAIITRVITPTHARELYPWLDLPAVVQAVEEWFDKPQVEFGSAHEFREELDELLLDASRGVEAREWDPNAMLFSPTPAQREQLDLRQISSQYNERAFNVTLWDQLQAEAKKAAKENKPKGTKTAKKSQKEQQAAAQEKFRQAVAKYAEIWLTNRIGEYLRKEPPAHLPWLVYLATTDGYQWKISNRIKDRLKKPGEPDEQMARLARTSKLNESLLAEAILDVKFPPCAGGFEADLEDNLLGATAIYCGIDLKKEWQPETGFLDLFESDVEIQDMIQEFFPEKNLNAVIAAGYTNESVLKNWPKGKVPKCLLDAE
jgi:ParB/RepB/Spo0J family partition protein